jgi:hypothetical protein
LLHAPSLKIFRAHKFMRASSYNANYDCIIIYVFAISEIFSIFHHFVRSRFAHHCAFHFYFLWCLDFFGSIWHVIGSPSCNIFVLGSFNHHDALRSSDAVHFIIISEFTSSSFNDNKLDRWCSFIDRKRSTISCLSFSLLHFKCYCITFYVSRNI